MVVGRVVLSYEHGVPRRVTVAATVYEQLLTLGVAAAGAVLFVVLFGTAGAVQVWLLALLPLGLRAAAPARSSGRRPRGCCGRPGGSRCRVLLTPRPARSP